MRSVLAVLIVALALAPTAAAMSTSVFDDDGATLARLELNGDGHDASGHGRDAIVLSPTYAPTPAGEGASITTSAQGIDWSAHAGLLAPPFTIEMVFSPGETSCWRKIVGGDDGVDAGWYLCDRAYSFPTGGIGPSLVPGARHYVALRSVTATSLRVFVDGVDVGTVGSFSFPSPQAVFFRDDTVSFRAEQFNGTVDAMRFSSSERSAHEIAAVQCRVADTCGHFLLSSASAGVAGRSLMRQSGNWDTLDVGLATPRTWRASEAAATDTTFGETPFEARLHYKGLAAGDTVTLELGTMNPSGVFSPIPGATGLVTGTGAGEESAVVPLPPDHEFVVPADHHLALRASSTSTTVKVHTGGQLQSYLVPGQAAPAPPIPELPSLLLVGAGAIGVALVLARRR